MVVWNMKTHMIIKTSRPLARSGAKRRQNARVDATFHDHMCFHIQNQIKSIKNGYSRPRKSRGRAEVEPGTFWRQNGCLEYENAYDREKVASTLAFWRLLAPERASGRDFFTIICVSIVKIE